MNIIWYFVGLVVGSIITLILTDLECSRGTLEIDTKYNEDQDMYYVDLGNIDKLPKKRYVKLKIIMKK